MEVVVLVVEDLEDAEEWAEQHMDLVVVEVMVVMVVLMQEVEADLEAMEVIMEAVEEDMGLVLMEVTYAEVEEGILLEEEMVDLVVVLVLPVVEVDHTVLVAMEVKVEILEAAEAPIGTVKEQQVEVEFASFNTTHKGANYEDES